MHNYKKDNKEKSKQFITKCKVKKGKITLVFLDGSNWTMPYTKENEENIINKREEQLQEINLHDVKANTKKSIFLYFALILACLFVGSFFIQPVIFGGATFLNAFILSACGFFVLTDVLNILRFDLVIKEIEKIEFFLEEKEIITENINNENIKNGISKKTSKIIEKKLKYSDRPIDINNLDSIPLEDLRIIRNNISRQDSYQTKETVDCVEPKQLVLDKQRQKL